MNPVTIVADLKGLFGNSKLGEVFSADGLSAFLDVEFHKLYIFYVACFNTFLFLYALKVAFRKDREDIKIRSGEELVKLKQLLGKSFKS